VVCWVVLASRFSFRATCLHYVPLNCSRTKLLDKAGEPKSVTLTLDCLVIGECIFNDVMVLFDFWFDGSGGLEEILFSSEILRSLWCFKGVSF
jgi:hypothetical protein